MRRLKIGGAVLFAAMLLSTSVPSTAQADLWSRMHGCVARVLKKVLDRGIANYEGHTLRITENFGQPEPMELKLGKSLGNGFAGRAYVVESAKNLELPPNASPELVVKLGHRSKKLASPGVNTTKDKLLVAEYEEYTSLMRQMDQLWADPALRETDSPWTAGSIPMAPIYRMLDTDQGVMLVKSRLKGKTLKDLYTLYGDQIENYPPEIRQGVHDVFKLAQAVRRRVKIRDLKTGTVQAFRLDLKPENYLWVEDPATLAASGLKRPGFVFFEFSHLPYARYPYDETTMTIEEYEDVFVKYVRFNAPK